MLLFPQGTQALHATSLSPIMVNKLAPSLGVADKVLEVPTAHSSIAVALHGLLLILWPYTPGLTTSVHRGLPDAAIPIRDPGFTRHEPFTNYG